MSAILVRLVAFSILWAAGSFGQQAALATGSIEGTVLSDDGQPAADVMVYAVPEKGSQPGLKFPRKTDASGTFRIEGVRVGRTVIYAYGDGYPDSSFAFYSGNRPSTVVTVIGGETTKAEVRLAARCAYLIGTVENAESGAVVRAANFRLTRADDPNIWLSTAPVGGHFRLAVPSGVAFQLQISAEQFRTWVPTGALALDPGAEFPLDVRLLPADHR